MDDCVYARDNGLPNNCATPSGPNPNPSRMCACGSLREAYCSTPVEPPNTAFYKAIYPTAGTTGVSLTPTFSWEANTTGIAYNNLYVSQTCDYDAATGQWFDHVPLGSRTQTLTTPLQPSKTYYWNIYGTGGSAGTKGLGCVSFVTTVSAPPECTTDSACSADKKCESNKCVAVICITGAPVCKKYVVSNHACVLQNDADGTVCTTDKSCVSGVCTLIPNEANACWGNLGTGANAGRCYDCNGDGVINILDFSCFAKRWREKI